MHESIVAQEEKLMKASKLATGVIHSIDAVKCFNGQQFETRRYKAAVLNAGKSYLEQAKVNSLQIGFIRFATLAMFVQGFWYGSHLVNTGKSSAGNILTTFWASLMATKAVEDILPFVIILEKGRAAGAGLQAIMLEVGRGKSVRHGQGISKEPEYCEGDIEMRNVSPRFAAASSQASMTDRSRFHLRIHHNRRSLCWKALRFSFQPAKQRLLWERVGQERAPLEIC